jgi:hypothetical protein
MVIQVYQVKKLLEYIELLFISNKSISKFLLTISNTKFLSVFELKQENPITCVQTYVLQKFCIQDISELTWPGNGI